MDLVPSIPEKNNMQWIAFKDILQENPRFDGKKTLVSGHNFPTNPLKPAIQDIFHGLDSQICARCHMTPRQVTGLRIPPEMANGVAESAWVGGSVCGRGKCTTSSSGKFIWLVVWNINYIFPLIFGIIWECHHPNWRSHIFQRGGPTTNQLMKMGKLTGKYGGLFWITIFYVARKKWRIYKKTGFKWGDVQLPCLIVRGMALTGGIRKKHTSLAEGGWLPERCVRSTRWGKALCTSEEKRRLGGSCNEFQWLYPAQPTQICLSKHGGCPGDVMENIMINDWILGYPIVKQSQMVNFHGRFLVDLPGWLGPCSIHWNRRWITARTLPL